MWQGAAPTGLPGRPAPHPGHQILSPALGEEKLRQKDAGAPGPSPLLLTAAEPAPGIDQVEQHVPGPGPQGEDGPGQDPGPEVR